MLVGILPAGFSQTSQSQETDTLCFTLEQLRRVNVRMAEGKAASDANYELNKQVLWMAAEAQERQNIIIDFMAKEVKYIQNDSLHTVNLATSQEQTKLYKKKGRRDKWVWGGVGLGVGVLVGVLVGLFAK